MANKAMVVWGFSLALVIVAPGQVDAQAQIGLNAGVTVASLGDEAEGLFGDVIDLDTETGFFAGASLSLSLNGILSVTPGLYVVQKGMSFAGEFSGRGFVELSYIEVPVTIGVEVTGPDRPFGVSLFAGPEIAFEIDCDGVDVLALEAFEDCQTDEEVPESDRRTTDFGLVVGADVSYGDFFVNGGLDVGLTSLGDDRAGEEFRNSAWFLGAGILIGG